MTYRSVLLDTSAIIAFFKSDEDDHVACAQIMREIVGPAITSYPVLTEAHYMLQQYPRGQRQLLALAKSDAIIVDALGDDFLEWFEGFTSRYQDQDTQIADASLVWLASKFETNTVFTLDRRDFSIFRRDDGTAFQIIPE